MSKKEMTIEEIILSVNDAKKEVNQAEEKAKMLILKAKENLKLAIERKEDYYKKEVSKLLDINNDASSEEIFNKLKQVKGIKDESASL